MTNISGTNNFFVNIQPGQTGGNQPVGGKSTDGTAGQTGAGNISGAREMPNSESTSTSVAPTYTPPNPKLDDPTGTEARLENARRALMESNNAAAGSGAPSGGATTKELFRLMIETQANQRTAALQSRTLGYEQAQAHSLAQAAEMTNAADDMEAGAEKAMIISAVVGGVGMAMSAGSAIAQGRQVTKMAQTARMGAADEVLDTTSNLGQKFAVDTKRFDVTASVGSLGQTVGGIGSAQANAQDSTSQADAKRHEAKGSEEAAQSSAAQQRADMAKEVQQAMSEMINQIINQLKEMQEAKVDAMRAITRG
ncbi:hypothetical protein [Aureimonas jatrophae]|uniref:Uncharacterized protein n=1 Tax=Aureimonas jatrophae TaxID=1166073 RepID=A0A1H0ESY0_9HYPH|nr:hypothetical protein [Aureimonas jatrophae]MBB3950334.1 hypothetical protein [Aureimonas jatrophae]SDN85389.1 hypothetical protein SAMN05192530_102201 [Aureimonas jatrophae]